MVVSKRRLRAPINEGDAYERYMPQHGEPYDPSRFESREPEGYNEPDEDDEDEDEEDDPKHGGEAAMMRRLDEMATTIGELRAQNEYLSRSIPPAARPQQNEPPKEEEPDWEELLFKNPKEALRLHGEMIRKQVTTELTQSYQQEQSNNRFWTDFYAKHDDLREDHDLVMSTLNKHFAELGNMPSSKAQDKLADLTRERIMKYSGESTGKKKRGRAFTEGASEPRPARRTEAEAPSGSLSSLIKDRRMKRYQRRRGRVA